MKINQKTILLILFASIGFYSCDSFLTQELENVYQTDLIEENPLFAQGILFYGYSRMINSYQFDDVATDDAVSNDITNSSNNYANFRRLATGEWSSYFDPTNVWANSYNAINNVNYFLTFVNNVEWSIQYAERNELFKKRYNAEARALRGYHYLRLLSRYGGVASNGALLGVPVTGGLITSEDNTSIPRPPFQTTMDQIIADLDYAIANFPYTFDATNDPHFNHVYQVNNNRGRINGQIAWALKARAALLGASPAYNGGAYDLNKAEFAAQVSGELLKKQGGLASLAPKRIFWNDDNDINNPEIIWRENSANSNTLELENYPPLLWGSGRINPTQNLVDAFPMKNGYPITMLDESGYDPASPYENRDERLLQNIFVNGSTLRNTRINTSTDRTLENGNANTNGLNVQPLYSTRTGYYLRKLLRETVNLDPASRNNARHFYTHMRWTEMYLIYAEAANEAFGPDADPNNYGFTPREIIAAIRQRAGIDQPDDYLDSITGKEAMRDMIRNERRLEFCFEGYRFWDLRRWNLPLDVTARGTSITGDVHTHIDVEARAYKPYMIYCPIPNAEVIKYPELLQNNNW